MIPSGPTIGEFAVLNWNSNSSYTKAFFVEKHIREWL